jgi:DNA repair exonuclease SbcCD ATPase subunit
MVMVYGLYCRQLQIIKKLRSLHPTTILDPDASELPELEKKLREADARIEASMDRIREIRGETRKTLNSLQEKETPSPTRQQALTALNAIASGANDIREQCQDIETIRDALNRLPADA